MVIFGFPSLARASNLGSRLDWGKSGIPKKSTGDPLTFQLFFLYFFMYPNLTSENRFVTEINITRVC